MASKQPIPEGYVEKTEKSVAPIYAAGITVLSYALCFPLYKPGHFVLCAAVTAAVYFLLDLLLPKKTVYEPCRPKSTGDASADELLTQGRRLLSEIKEANDRIPDEEVSRKITRIEEICKKIFAHIERYPEKEKKLRRFIGYYLPTTRKLLASYIELDASGFEGETIRASKEKISSSLDMIGEAFEKQFDALFSDLSLDVSSDIKVLEGILASQGLSENKEEEK